MKRANAALAQVKEGLVEVVLDDGRIITVIFDEYGMPHAGRVLTASTPEGYIIEMILPYEVRVIRPIGGEPG